jgi:hypothetical protein
LWRAVEAQHVASTLRLVASAEEQALLEQLLDDTKPPLPTDAQALHYLLATPFRYVSPVGSRFRAPAHAGIWYGAEAQRTACAELGFWRWQFLVDSDGLEALDPAPQTVLCAGIDARLVDLTAAPFKRARPQWTDPRDYGPTQAFALTAREADIDAIRYESVRDPERGGAIAVLRPSCFKPHQPLTQEMWFLTVRRAVVIWQGADTAFEFDAAAWQR